MTGAKRHRQSVVSLPNGTPGVLSPGSRGLGHLHAGRLGDPRAHMSCQQSRCTCRVDTQQCPHPGDRGPFSAAPSVTSDSGVGTGPSSLDGKLSLAGLGAELRPQGALP